MTLTKQSTMAGHGGVIFLSPNDYARTFSVSRATTWRRIADRTLSVHRLGPRTVRIAVAAADLVAPNRDATSTPSDPHDTCFPAKKGAGKRSRK